MAAAGPSVQLGLRVRSRSSVLEVKKLKAGNEAVGLNRPLFLPPCKHINVRVSSVCNRAVFFTPTHTLRCYSVMVNATVVSSTKGHKINGAVFGSVPLKWTWVYE